MGCSSMIMYFFYLDPLQKTGYCQGKEVKHWDECHTCDEKRGEGKGKIKHRPKDEKWTSKPVFICLSAKKESACIVTSRYPGFVGGLSKKKHDDTVLLLPAIIKSVIGTASL